MIKDKHIKDVSLDDLNKRFSEGGWQSAGGNLQSVTFMQGILSTLDPVLGTFRLAETGTIYDFGCAEGDGTAVLQAYFGRAQVIGLDKSPAAIERARDRWGPIIQFGVADLEDPSTWPPRLIKGEPTPVPYVFCSHTLEHLEDIPTVINNLRGGCSVLVVAVPPAAGIAGDVAHVGSKPLGTWLWRVPPNILKHFTAYRNIPLTEFRAGDVEFVGNNCMEDTAVLLYSR